MGLEVEGSSEWARCNPAPSHPWPPHPRSMPESSPSARREFLPSRNQVIAELEVATDLHAGIDTGG